MVVPKADEEAAIARLLELAPEGYEVVEHAREIELATYVDAEGAEALRDVFGTVRVAPVSEGWEQEWKRFHRPVAVGPLWIGPPWETPPPDKIAAYIDPGRAFGTGAHETTRLSLELLAGLPRASLLDVGCGSGVLAIAAAKLGYAPVTAVDVEDAAVEETLRNAAANGVELEARKVDALREPLPAADVVVANILLPAVQALAPRLDCALLVTSGYFRDEQPGLPGFEHRDRRTGERWAADVFERG